MNKKIESHVNALFANTPGGAHVSEIQEELLANLNEKYDDLVSGGRSEEEAFAQVISGIGDIDNLLNDLGVKPEYKSLEIERKRTMRSVFISIGIALYIISVAPLVLFSELYGLEEVGLVITLIICAVATGLVIFGNSISKNNYTKKDNSFVEEYKEKLAANNDRKKLVGAASSALWAFIFLFYFTFSFMTGFWHVSWIIFLVGACAEEYILCRVAAPEKRKHYWHGILWTITAILYFIISFATGMWQWTWLIFIATVAIEQVIRLIVLWKKTAANEQSYKRTL